MLAILLFAAAATAAAPNELPVITIPNGSAGIGFDDVVYSPALKRLVVPAGRTGSITLIDPDSRAVTLIRGFSSSDNFTGGHDFGVTSADAANGVLYAIDRTAKELVVVDTSKRNVVTRVKLAGDPDYVRYVAASKEVWVTEPDAQQIEVFSAEDPRAPKAAAAIHVEGGPESLVIDGDRAYTNSFRTTTYAINVGSHAIESRWENGCERARGIAVDREHDVVFVGCAEGKATALHDGKVVATEDAGAGVDIIDFANGRLFVASGGAGTLTIFTVDDEGHLTKSKTVETTAGAHCVAADPRGRAYVCDPAKGRLLVVDSR